MKKTGRIDIIGTFNPLELAAITRGLERGLKAETKERKMKGKVSLIMTALVAVVLTVVVSIAIISSTAQTATQETHPNPTLAVL